MRANAHRPSFFAHESHARNSVVARGERGSSLTSGTARMLRLPAHGFIIVGLLVSACTMSSSHKPLKPEDPTYREVRQSLDRLSALLAAKDPAMLAEFTASTDMLLIGSDADEIVEGRQAFEDFIHRLFALPVKLGWEWRTIRVSQKGDIAWVFANGDLVVRDAKREQRTAYRMTGVLEERNGRWTWRLFHGSAPGK